MDASIFTKKAGLELLTAIRGSTLPRPNLKYDDTH